MHLSQSFRHCRFLGLIALGCLSSSCNSESNQADKVKKPQTSSVAKPKLVYKPTGPDKAIYDLLPVNSDTLIAVKWHGGLAITTDAGLHWQNLHDQPQKHDFLYFKHLTIDEHHILWGLDSWPGMHEPAYSRLAYSADFGNTWKHLEFDTHKFFPYEFYSLPGKPLRIIAYDGTVSQMQDRAGKKWKSVKTVVELDNSVNDTIPGDSFFSGGQFKFLETGQLFSRTIKGWHPIVTAGFINEVNDVCSCAGSTYVVGYNGAVSPTPHYLLRIANGQVRDTTVLPDEDQRYLRCDKKGRLWLFNFRGVWRKSGNRLVYRY
ncbi:WD40/YVTN/BNR-like repeat-containing protein [Hymenobacter negativus]|uniref:Photosynthesis system II assembly factor Ycf48/Hcf136-like domain-containing protein n=1 Tax=Hymenobacter negativus TaxID=2795026 RepID=A0ABS0Q1M4_9BACT|nr:hypothetical protein [Hymenobacter negativus]MBH8556551.1 hypothetical protein [Hymenobacter negativus]